jgi:hypothetical protein
MNHSVKSFYLSLFLLVFNVLMSSAQSKELVLDEATMKQIKKEAKNLRKEGWEVFPGDLPIEEQLKKIYIKRVEKYMLDETIPRWVFGDGHAIVNQLNLAKDWSMENAKIDLLSKMGGLIQKTIESQYTENESVKSIESIKQLVSSEIKQKLNYSECILRMYRLVDGNYEVNAKIIYKYDDLQYAVNKQFNN